MTQQNDPKNVRPEFARIEKLRENLATQKLDGIWVTRPANVRYLSGFTTPEDGVVLVTNSETILFTDNRYSLQAEQESAIAVNIPTPKQGQNRAEALLDAAQEFVNNKNLAFEAEHLNYNTHAKLFHTWKHSKLHAMTDFIVGQRSIKDEAEIETIQFAAQHTDNGILNLLPHLKPGATEIDLALMLENDFRREGDGPAFEIIVASGERGAMPHGLASKRKLQNNELVTIDCGAKHQGYCADLTRTYAVGNVSTELRNVYHLVLEAQQTALHAIKPGARGADIDAIARKIIEQAGYGQYFGHSLGHGVGLEIHEGPNLSKASNDILVPGNVVTVEPGIYIPGLGGVRIEDLVVVTSTGVECLSQSEIPKL